MNNKGFSLIEIMIITGIISILSLIALPYYNNYILRVKIAGIINEATIIVRDSQIAMASGEYSDTNLDLQEIARKTGATLRPNGSGYSMGYRRGSVLGIQKDKTHLIGLNPKYLKSVSIISLLPFRENGAPRFNTSTVLRLELDLKELIGITTNDRVELVLTVTTAATYYGPGQDEGEAYQKYVGSRNGSAFMTCGLFMSYKTVLPAYLHSSALPRECRYAYIGNINIDPSLAELP